MPFTEESYKADLSSMMAGRRRQLEETQEDVARAIDVPLSVYRGWETGRSAPRGVAWLRLCQHFEWPHPLLTAENSLSTEIAFFLQEQHRTPLSESETLVLGGVFA